MLDVIHISKQIDKKDILIDCSFKISHGQILGIVGINGAGKSTLLQICAGIMKPEKGIVLLDNTTIYDHYRSKKDIIYIPDSPHFDYDMSLKRLVEFYSCFYKIDLEYYNYLCSKFNVDETIPLIKLSKGKVKQAFTIVAFAIHPKLILLDETFDGLDPLAKKIFKDELDSEKMKNSIIVITSHSLKEITDCCDSVVFLRQKTTLALGDKDYYDDPIYRVIATSNCEIFNTNILKKEQLGNMYLVDIHVNKDIIIKELGEQLKYIERVPFDDWIYYQMEKLV